MKKLLTVVCLVLTLVLACSSAMAATKYQAQFDSLEEYRWASIDGIKIGDRVVFIDSDDLTVATIKNAPHAQPVTVNAKGHTLDWAVVGYEEDPEGDWVKQGDEYVWGYKQGEIEDAAYDENGNLVLNDEFKANPSQRYTWVNEEVLQFVEDEDGAYYLVAGSDPAKYEQWVAGKAKTHYYVDYYGTEVEIAKPDKFYTLGYGYTPAAPADGGIFYKVGDEYVEGKYGTKEIEKYQFNDQNGDELGDVKLYSDEAGTASAVTPATYAGETLYYKDGEAYKKVKVVTYTVEVEDKTKLVAADGSTLPAGTTTYEKKANSYEEDPKGAYAMYEDKGLFAWSTKDISPRLAKDGETPLPDTTKYFTVSGSSFHDYFKEDAAGAYYRTEDGNYEVVYAWGDGFWRTEDGELVPMPGTRYSEAWVEVEPETDIGVTVSVVIDPHTPKLDKTGMPIWGSKEDPTCAGGGYSYLVCEVCGEEYAKIEWAATGHNLAWVTVVKPTCETKGKAELQCSHCNGVFGTKELAALGHDYGWRYDEPKYWEVLTPAACDEKHQTVQDGVAYFDTCKNCCKHAPWAEKCAMSLEDYQNYLLATKAIKKISEYDGHKWDKWVDDKAATCGSGATEKRWCKVCNLIEYRVKDKSEPLKANYQIKSKYLTGPTLNCVADPDDFVFVCTNCNGKVHEIVPVNKDWDDEVKMPYFWADIDGKTIQVYLSHNLVEDTNDKKVYNKDWGIAGCDDAQYKHVVCTLCDYEGLKKVADATGHLWSDWTVAQEGTGAATKLWTRHCTRKTCDAVQTKAQATKPVDCKEQGKEHVLVPVDATTVKCGENKNVALKCANCDYTVTKDYTLEHDWETTVVTAPTCQKAGLALKKCKLCKLEKSEELPKVDHTAGEPIVTPATLEKEGSEVVKCTVCGETLSTKVLPKLVPAPKYTLTAEYSGSTVTGKLAHVEGTQDADTKNIRVTFYIEGNYYMATMAEVAADGTFSVDGVGPITYITVAATGNTSVNPEDYQKIAEAQEIIVD